MDPDYGPIKPILSNNRLKNEVELWFSHAERLKTAKGFGQCQPAYTAQADMGRYFSQMHGAALSQYHSAQSSYIDGEVRHKTNVCEGILNPPLDL